MVDGLAEFGGLLVRLAIPSIGPIAPYGLVFFDREKCTGRIGKVCFRDGLVCLVHLRVGRFVARIECSLNFSSGHVGGQRCTLALRRCTNYALDHTTNNIARQLFIVLSSRSEFSTGRETPRQTHVLKSILHG